MRAGALDRGRVGLESVGPSARTKGLRFAWGVDDDAPPVIDGDRVRLRQMLLHVATNAVTFTDRGGIVIRASRPALSP